MIADRKSNLGSQCKQLGTGRYLLGAALGYISQWHLNYTRLLFSTNVNIMIIFSIKRDCSFEYKTVLKNPGFRNRLPSVDFSMCGSVRNKDASGMFAS